MKSIEMKELLKGEIENELVRIRQALKGVGEESYLSLSHLSKVYEWALGDMEQNIQVQIANFHHLAKELANNEHAQELLIGKLKEGALSCREYAAEQNKLVLEQAKLKSALSNLTAFFAFQIKKAENKLVMPSQEELATASPRHVSIYQEQENFTKISRDKMPSLNAQKMVMSSYSYSKEKEYGLPAIEELNSLASLFKKSLSLKVGAFYSIAKMGVEKNQEAMNWWNALLAKIKTGWKIDSSGWAEFGAGMMNLARLDWRSALKNREHSKKLGVNKNKYLYNAWNSTFEEYELNTRAEKHNDIILVNNNAIKKYIKELENVELTLGERIELLSKIQKMENVNWAYNSSDLTDLYKNFRSKESYQYGSIEIDNSADLALVEKYFSLLNKGFVLSKEEQEQYVESIHKIISGINIGWMDGEKDQFKSYFLTALTNNTDHVDRINALQSYSDKIKAILSEVPDFSPQVNRENQEMTVTPNRSTGFFNEEKIVEIQPIGMFDPTLLEEEIQQQKEYYQQDIMAYVVYLKHKRKLLEEDQSSEGVQKRAFLDNVIKDAESDRQIQLQNLLDQYQGYTTKMTSLTTSYKRDMDLLNQAMKDASTEAERQRIEEAIDMRTDGYTASLVNMEAENEGFSKVLFGDLRNISKEALNEAIAEARDFIAQWSANAGELSPETEKVVRKIQEGIEKAETSLNETGGKKDDFAMADQFRDAAAALQGCADLAYVFDESLGDVIQTAADVAQGAADIAAGVASFSANPLQGATSILGGVTKIVGSLGKRMQENEKIRQEYLQGLVETYSKELEYNSVLRERLRIQQQLGETSLDYFNRLQTELGKQQGDINREYTEVWNKLMKEQYISGTGYKHGTWLRKAKTWNEYDSLAGKSYEEIESLYTQDKLEGSAKTLFERLRELKEEGADVVEMMDQLNEEMKESWTGTTTSAITDSIVQGFLDGKRSAADFADTFEDMMKTAMMQSVKMKYLEGPLEEWYAKFAEASEGGLTEEKIAELRRQYEQIVANAAREAENMKAITGLGASAEAARQATAQGIASMSQETASELNGNFYALQYLTSNIDRNVTNIQSVLYQASDQWIRIEENTRYCRKLETMEKDMSAIRKDMQDINNKGILMRTR